MGVARIVVAEDDASIRELLVHHIEREGFVVLACADGVQALRYARSAVDLVILDVGLPAVDGFEVARTLRREGNTTPILMVTARCDELDRIVGFEIGADDYVVKPFSPREIVVRVRAILRRAHIEHDKRAGTMSFGRLEIDGAGREVRVDGVPVPMKPREFALLHELASNPNVALSRTTLLERVWGFDYDGDERTVDVHVRRVRVKIERSPRMPTMVQTVHGFGYKFAAR